MLAFDHDRLPGLCSGPQSPSAPAAATTPSCRRRAPSTMRLDPQALALAAVMVAQGLLNMDQWKTLAEALFCSFSMVARWPRSRCQPASSSVASSMELTSHSRAAAHPRQVSTWFRRPAAWLLSTGKLLSLAALGEHNCATCGCCGGPALLVDAAASAHGGRMVITTITNGSSEVRSLAELSPSAGDGQHAAAGSRRAGSQWKVRFLF